MAEKVGLKPIQCGFESRLKHNHIYTTRENIVNTQQKLAEYATHNIYTPLTEENLTWIVNTLFGKQTDEAVRKFNIVANTIDRNMLL